MQTQNKQGGARQGAGRKKSAAPGCSITLYVSTEAKALAGALRLLGVKVNRVFEEALAAKYHEICGKGK